MAVAFRDAATGSKTSGSGLQLVINVPAGTVDGDVMIAVVTIGSAVAAATQGSWTILDTQTSGPTVRSFWRIASSEPGSYTFTVTDAQSSTGVIVSYSGAHAVSPIDLSGAWNRLTSTANISATTITPSENDCMIVWLGGAGASTATTSPGGYTERGDIAGAGSVNSVVAELLQTTAIPTGTVTGTASGATGNTQGSLVAIAPAAAAPPSVVQTLAPFISVTTNA